ncbi:DEAD/DEAH box helicase [Candidatus Woesearchaeota archaeon]|nr:DEAD/DEAH box helicase [Candidatus Woesearchaeota archaeon]
MIYDGLELDKFQEDAIRAIEKGDSVIVSAPTGSGKTLIADYIIDRDFKTGTRVIYTAPIKALSNQKFKDFSKKYGSENVGLITGDLVKNSEALILVMTTEIYRNMVLTKDAAIENVSYVIFDEIHYINDVERGYVWEESIIFSSERTRMLCLSATIPNDREFADWIRSIKKHEVTVVRHETRPVPLSVFFFDDDMGITTFRHLSEVTGIPEYAHVMGSSRSRRKLRKPSHADLISEIGDNLPCLFFAFSRGLCQSMAKELLQKRLFQEDPGITAFIRKKLSNYSPEINKLESVSLLRQSLPNGIGFHHAGLIPVAKEIVEELFSMGLIKVLYATETFALGVNMPARSVCLQSLRKFDGRNFRMMNSKEYFQMAGRAGRRGIDEKGYVYFMVDRADFDAHKVKRLISRDTEPIKSQFRLSINTVLNLIRLHSDEEINAILSQSFDAFQKKRKNLSSYTFEKFKRDLEKKGFLKNGKLTYKGQFAARIYADELVVSEIFATRIYENLNHYQALLIFACICFEARETIQFRKRFPSRDTARLKAVFAGNETLSREKKFMELEELSSIIFPCYKGDSIFKLMEFTSMVEGDLLRLFRQMLDRMNQVKTATSDRNLRDFLGSCQATILNCIKEVDGI